MDFMIEAKDLTKRYDDLMAVDGLNIGIKKGRSFWISRTQRCG